MADSIEDRFAVETELLGLKLLPGQEANLRAAYAVLREAVALVGVGADYPFEAEPAHVFAPAPARDALQPVEKLRRDARVAILFGQATRKAAFATNDSGRYWRRSGARRSGGGRRAAFWRSHGAQNRR